MKRIAYLASQITLPGSPGRRSDAFEHDQMMSALLKPFQNQNLNVEDIAWDDPAADWSTYDAVMIGTTWDYWDRERAFLDTLKDIESKTLLCNAADTIQWNIHKSYLKSLEAKGANLIPTVWLDKVTEQTAKQAFETLGSDDLVFKRQVGAGADGQYRLSATDALPDMPHPMMVQPFLSNIQTEGELSFIFVDGKLSHTVLKRAKSGDYRIQSTYGGYDEVYTPSDADVAAASAVLRTLDSTPLYARVDMLRGPNGSLLLMELELIEPFLYPLQGPELGHRLATAISARLT